MKKILLSAILIGSSALSLQSVNGTPLTEEQIKALIIERDYYEKNFTLAVESKRKMEKDFGIKLSELQQKLLEEKIKSEKNKQETFFGIDKDLPIGILIGLVIGAVL